MKISCPVLVNLSLLAVLVTSTNVQAKNTPPAEEAPASNAYSPYADSEIPRHVYFGDTHLHTTYSADAGLVGAILGPEDAYRLARGEQIQSSYGLPIKLLQPYDFLAVTDHSENLGLAPILKEASPELLKVPWAAKVAELLRKGDLPAAYDAWAPRVQAQDDPLKGKSSMLNTPAWKRITAAAENYNEPGRFTALIGFEWTSMPDGNNLHRNVIFQDGKDKADKIVPFSYYDSGDPEDLWAWMSDYEKQTGGKLLAIPHNGNLSNGLMFDDVTFSTRKPLNSDYAKRRQAWEPIYEVTQPKGDGEAHPALSTTDEFADFETWDRGSFGSQVKQQNMLAREYAREALKRGLAYEAELGVNPFKFGLIGATDSHNALSTTREDNFFSKMAVFEPGVSDMRWDEVVVGRYPKDRPRNQQHLARELNASGITAVWAHENTREALWDAMMRREVYATTGSRIKVRVFGGFDFTEKDIGRSDFAEYGYSHGVPMGGDLTRSPNGSAPSFLVQALRDANGANLDRIQIIKGWHDEEGKLHEHVYDIAWSGDRTPKKDGKLAAVGNTVDVKTATYSNSIGASTLQAFWVDPQFSSNERAFYYVRVLEIPTPRWTTYDAKRLGVPLPTDVPSITQDRAYTSPIWYTP